MGLRVPSCWHSCFHEGVQAPGSPVGSCSLPVSSRSEFKAPEPSEHRRVGWAPGSHPSLLPALAVRSGSALTPRAWRGGGPAWLGLGGGPAQPCEVPAEFTYKQRQAQSPESRGRPGWPGAEPGGGPAPGLSLPESPGGVRGRTPLCSGALAPGPALCGMPRVG